MAKGTPFLLFLLFFSFSAKAASLFGAEFTFTNDEIYSKGIQAGPVVDIPEAVAAQKKMLEEFTKDCVKEKTCTVKTIVNHYGVDTYRVTFKKSHGFWLQISTDPSVVEVQSKASTVAEYTEAKPILEKLFAAAKAVGINPHATGGGGHIHMDFTSTFETDKHLFRNFLVDYVNNQELGGAGVLGSDPSNAPHLTLLSDAQKAEFRKIIGEFDQGKFRTARDLARAVNTRVYTSNPSGWNEPAEKYQALNLTRMKLPNGEATVEFRSISPQRSPEEFLKETQLLEARVEFLRKQKGNLPLLDYNPLSAEEKVAAFRAYVEESGLKWEDYIPLVRNYWGSTELPAKSRVPAEFCEGLYARLSPAPATAPASTPAPAAAPAANP